KAHLLKMTSADHIRICHAPTVAREAQMSGISGRGGDRLGLAQYFPRLLLNGYAPQVHAPASVAGKVEILAIRRPDRVPIRRGVVCHFHRLTPARRNGRDVALCCFTSSLVSDPMPMRRPVGLHGIFFRDEPSLSRGDIHGPDSAVRVEPALGLHDTLVSTGDLLPVGRPGRVEAEIRQSLNTLARRSHHEDASALPL